MQIAPKHSDAERQSAGHRVEKWLLLDRVALDAAYVAPGHVKRPAAIEPDLADAIGAIGDGAVVAAGVAVKAAAVNRLVKLARPHTRLKQVLEGHRSIVG